MTDQIATLDRGPVLQTVFQSFVCVKINPIRFMVPFAFRIKKEDKTQRTDLNIAYGTFYLGLSSEPVKTRICMPDRKIIIKSVDQGYPANQYHAEVLLESQVRDKNTSWEQHKKNLIPRGWRKYFPLFTGSIRVDTEGRVYMLYAFWHKKKNEWRLAFRPIQNLSDPKFIPVYVCCWV